MEGAGGRVSLGDVAQQVLGLALPGEGAPILAKRKSVERKIDEAKREERDSHALSRAKRSLAVQAHRKLRGAFVFVRSHSFVGIRTNSTRNSGEFHS